MKSATSTDTAKWRMIGAAIRYASIVALGSACAIFNLDWTTFAIIGLLTVVHGTGAHMQGLAK